MMQTMTEAVCVWMDEKVPARIVWRGERYRITDTPTPLRGYFAAPELTHPLEPQWGWRFQGTNDSGMSYVFDVRIGAGQAWDLVALYD